MAAKKKAAAASSAGDRPVKVKASKNPAAVQQATDDDLFVVDRKGVNDPKKQKGKKNRSESGPSEAELADLLFGGHAFGVEEEEQAGAESGGRAEEDSEGEDDGEHAALGSDDGSQDSEEEGGGEEAGAASNKPVWHDEDDDEVEVDIASVDRLRKLRQTEEETTIDGVEYSERLKKQFSKVHGGVSWTTRKRVKSDDDGDELLRTTGGIMAGKGALLPQHALDVERMSDANQADVSDCVIQSVRFHPTSRLMLTAGLDKRLKLFQVDGKKNGKVQSVFFADLPISSAEFSADGGEVFVTGRRKHFYSYDLGAAKISKIENIMGREEKSTESLYVAPDNKHLCILGNCGKISLLSRTTKMWIADLKMNHDARAAAFDSDGRTLYTGGSGGLVYSWDLRMRRCILKFADEGSVGVSAIAAAPVGGLLAVGSTSGVVNTYDKAAMDGLSMGSYGELRPESRRGIMNLTTRIDNLRFNSDGQVLAMASHTKKQGMRLVHSSSSTVFANWPTAGTPLHYVSSVDFSREGGYVAMGNDRGKVLLYRLKHYA